MGIIKDILGIQSPCLQANKESHDMMDNMVEQINELASCSYTPQEIELALMVMAGYSAKDAKEKVAETLQKSIDS